ncbi:TPA: putative beta-lysine N-acetyltransferase [Bacillus cytotoxicus]|uniref:putative beta-lysine N-acetyltransferase n=1 Tax=Bacillus cytotoxicus TaxID=580165 RepID=UPI000D644929|nr:putative beta-lysine N-acetyltransferase [Bacillus cytotoxicus]HDR7295639.1 putative beta-lysine N-acetyltransferase [Bacillus cytotoxicus]HDR7880390.1 putative beta-lysine N-acetyltransferase [Bacillus cytotoxicus]
MNYYESFKEQTKYYTVEGVLDYFNKRVRVDHYTGNVEYIRQTIEELAKKHSFTKCIIKGKGEHVSAWLSFGFLLEATIPHYFQGHDAYFLVKYLRNERRNSIEWENEDQILNGVREKRGVDKQVPTTFILRKATEDDAEQLANVFGRVFEIYPTPLNQVDYVKQTMKEDTIYYVYELGGKIVSTASAEMNVKEGNAELTNCATLPEYRKHGFMKSLLVQLEEELRDRAIFCSYTIARSLSFGMNAAFHQLGYTYTGRLANNCYIFDKLEDMNVWVKDLSRINGQ